MSDEKSATPGPARIWLQWFGCDAEELAAMSDADREVDPVQSEVTWCSDHMHDTDIEYVRAESVADLLAALEACISNPYFSHWRISEVICDHDCPRCRAEAAIKAAKG